ncbi:MAG TPA: fatty acid desaturase [Gemmatimonadetes bacterium]|nr:fatty acid desaturase [Gemmatimonadota bacterium]
MLRYKRDVQTVAYMVVTSGLLVVQWGRESWSPILWALALWMALTVAVMTHNHNHVRTWKSGGMNRLHDWWLTVFYGFPVFAWIPTHNKNHHRYNNQPGDVTIWYRYSERNNAATLLTYPAISSWFQQRPIAQYLAHLKRVNRRELAWCVSQYVVLALWIGGALWIDWRKALLYVVAPQQFALFAVLVLNYLQHVHADEESEWNHSRNFVGRVANFLLLNNGFHTVHHEWPGLHWSRIPSKHGEIEHLIDPSLNEPNLLWALFRTYVLGLFVPTARTRNLRVERLAGRSSAT